MKIVSQLDASGYFIGPVEADESPLEPGAYLIPGGAVDVPPPVVPAGQRAKWVGGGFVLEVVPVEPPPTVATPTVPTSVTMRQARLALLSVDKLAQVNAAIAAIPDATQRAAAEIEWEYAQTVDRDSPFVQMLGTALALDLDALFTLAAQQ